MAANDLVKKAKRGNEKAFAELMQGEKHKLYRMAYLYVKNEDDALDVVQETIYKAYISIKKLKEPDYFSTWLTRILIHTALDFIKKNKLTVPFSEMEEFFPTRGDRLIDERLDLAEAIEQLEERYKTVIILRYFNDLSIKQIADCLNCPEGTVKTNLHRAINKLKLDIREAYIQ
ncbi:sigma-70 family RNA polymerase sigma factor [Fictibacillus fluitans]|uniref:Sigma-70 family RNA polymerase sigma factor n=1 Tax=Fictibacillus fluitans TaxID=3058422 RepID=A0ABT8HW04_9BACL|nr:sigma-70 family RNA polymerase sigma factor [Fictibacillus sp. NE201]MDN4524931.1 sigma-70 family RNA polymerase sigma factor [Fictibacillus sp. NE201]